MNSDLSINIGEIKFRGAGPNSQQNDVTELINKAMLIVAKKLSTKRHSNANLNVDKLALTFDVPPVQILSIAPERLADQILHQVETDLARKAGRPM